MTGVIMIILVISTVFINDDANSDDNSNRNKSDIANANDDSK